MAKLSTDNFLSQFGIALSHDESDTDLSALIPDGPYVDLKKKKRYSAGKTAAESVISIIGRRPLGQTGN